MTLALPSSSKEYLRTTVTASASPTASPPQFAFTATREDPAGVAWVNGEWVGGTTYDARILVGPGTSVVLAGGFYFCWLRITDNPEIPVRCFDTLKVT